MCSANTGNKKKKQENNNRIDYKEKGITYKRQRAKREKKKKEKNSKKNKNKQRITACSVFPSHITIFFLSCLQMNHVLRRYASRGSGT